MFSLIVLAPPEKVEWTCMSWVETGSGIGENAIDAEVQHAHAARQRQRGRSCEVRGDLEQDRLPGGGLLHFKARQGGEPDPRGNLTPDLLQPLIGHGAPPRRSSRAAL